MFEQLFEEMMDAHNVTMSQLATRLDIECHVLYRFKDGRGKRSAKLLKDILNVVPCDRDTDNKLREALLREELEKACGEDALECMNELKELFSVQFLSDDEMNMEIARKSSHSERKAPIWKKSESLISGRSSVRDAVMVALNSAREESDGIPVILWGRGTGTIVFDIACTFHNTEISVEHLYQLKPVTSPKSNLDNLKLLKEIMPCMRANFNYDVRVAYEELTSREAFFPFECLLMTNKAAFWIEKDYKYAQIITDANILEFYRAKFESQYKNNDAMLQRSVEIAKWQNEIQNTERCGKVSYYLNWQLCAMTLISMDVLEKHIKEDKKEYLLPQLNVFAERLQADKKKKIKIEYIMLDGVRYFMDTGKILELPDEWYIPFSKEERRKVLKTLLEIVQYEYKIEKAEWQLTETENLVNNNGTMSLQTENFSFARQIRIINANQFNLVKGIALGSFSEAHSYMSCLGYDGNMINFMFREAGITKWLFNFLKFLSESEWVYSTEEQVKLVEELLGEMEEQ